MNSSEEEYLMDKVLTFALIKCQDFLLSPVSNLPELKEYKKLNEKIVDFIAEKQGIEEWPLYPKEDLT